MAARLILVPHGETEWSLAGRHTSLTDVPLTDAGRLRAHAVGHVLNQALPSLALVSPRRRARETASIALPVAEFVVSEDLVEWHYGQYEGLTTDEIRARAPGWDLWRDGCPGGESPGDVARRADRVIALSEELKSSVVCFSHAHILRVLAARWLGLGPAAGALFTLGAATISVLGQEREQRVIERWNA
jgi:probable phosphoglycerate mutase